MPVGKNMDACARCGGGIWPETPTHPYCERCSQIVAAEKPSSTWQYQGVAEPKSEENSDELP